MDILQAAKLNQLQQAGKPLPIQVTIENMPPELQGKVLRLAVVSQVLGGKVQLQAANGQILDATLEPPLPQGTRLTLVAQAAARPAATPTPFDVTGLKLPVPVQSGSAPLPQPPVGQTVAPQQQPIPAPVVQVMPAGVQPVPLTLLPAQPGGTVPQLPLNTPLHVVVTAPPQGQSLVQQATVAVPLPQGVNTANVPMQIQLPQPLPVGTQITIMQPQAGPVQVQTLQLPAPTPTAPVILPAAPSTPPPILLGPITPTLPHTPMPELPLHTPISLTTSTPAQAVEGGFRHVAALTVPGQSAPFSVSVITSALLPPQTQVTVQQVQPQVFQAQAITLPPPGPLGTPPTMVQTPQILPPVQVPIQGLVTTADDTAGTATVRLPDGLQLTLKPQVPLNPGQAVQLVLAEDGMVTVQPLVLPVGSPRAEIAYHFAKEWPLLQQALHVLGGASSAVEASAHTNLPRPDVLLPTLLQFASAVQAQGVERFLGDETVQLLRALGVDLAPDLSSLNQLTQKPDGAADAWRGLLFPYVEQLGDDPQQGGFFWRQQDEDGGERGATRFVVQLALSQLGPMQLDGLMKEQTLNMKLRIQDLPEEDFQKNLRAVVHETLEAYGLRGSIAVERTTLFPFDPLAEIQHWEGDVAVAT